jgi:hypothetical protein
LRGGTLFGDGVLAFREFTMKERVPLATIQAAILGLLRSREDAVLAGAQAVNPYCDEPRMTQDVAILSSNARALADAILDEIAGRFHLAIRVRELGSERDYRVFQVRKPSNRHLVVIRSVEALPPAKRIGGILVVMVPELIARKLLAYRRRKGQPKSGTDWRDLAVQRRELDLHRLVLGADSSHGHGRGHARYERPGTNDSRVIESQICARGTRD